VVAARHSGGISSTLCGAQSEDFHRLRQLGSLLTQALRRGRALFDECGVLLGDLVKLAHGIADLANASRLFRRGRRDVSNELRDSLYLRDDVNLAADQLDWPGESAQKCSIPCPFFQRLRPQLAWVA
jgi:hypothetical protein